MRLIRGIISLIRIIPGIKKDKLPKISQIGKRAERRTQEFTQEELYAGDTGPKRKGITGDKLKWYDDFHFNNPESRYYNIMWEDLPGKRHGSGEIEYASKKLNDRYKIYVNQIQEYNKLKKRGWVPAADFFEKNGIDNWKLQELNRSSAKHLTRHAWFNKNIKIKKLATAVGGASRSLWIKAPDTKTAKEFVKRFSVSEEKLWGKTIEDINKLWSHKPFRETYLNGSYPNIEDVKGKFKNMTSSQAATATRRISQILGGTTFKTAEFK